MEPQELIGSLDDDPDDMLSAIVIREAANGASKGLLSVPDTVANMLELRHEYVDSLGGWFVAGGSYYTYEVTREPDGFCLVWDRHAIDSAARGGD